jgi:hypothetical protein
MNKPFLTQTPSLKTDTNINIPKNPKTLINTDDKKNSSSTSWLHDTCSSTEGDNNQ